MSNIRKQLEKRFGKYEGYIECDSGWDWILEELHEKMLYLDPKYELVQVKEKFGTLRFYLGRGGSTKNVAVLLMHDAINHAEYLSSKTCELCGNCSLYSNPSKGVIYDKTAGIKFNEHGWYKTLCNTCAEPLEYRESREDD